MTSGNCISEKCSSQGPWPGREKVRKRERREGQEKEINRRERKGERKREKEIRGR